jgi:hypothetical protein
MQKSFIIYMIPIDFIFTYWVFLLFIFYYITRFKYINPTILLWVALVEQVASFLYYTYIGLPILTLTVYAIIIVLIKAIPLYLIQSSKHKWNPGFSIFFFLTYLIYLKYNGTNIVEVYKQVNASMIRGTSDTPFFYYLKKIGINLTLDK